MKFFSYMYAEGYSTVGNLPTLSQG